MSKSKADLLNVRFFEDGDGVHLLLSGSLASNFQTLVDNCKQYCCCSRFSKKTA